MLRNPRCAYTFGACPCGYCPNCLGFQSVMNNFLRNVPKQFNLGKGPSPSGASTIAKVLLGGAAALYIGNNSLFNVSGGQRAVVFSRIFGVKETVYDEGTHFCIPWFEWPTVFDIRTRPKTSRSHTGTRDLQMVDVTLRVLYRPSVPALPRILSTLGTDYDERVLPSLVNETTKSVIAQFNASQLITQREQVSKRVRSFLTGRAKDFDILVDDVSITHLSFSQDYTAAVEAKQVAQQEAERARFVVDRATQDKKSTIIRAQGEARSAELIGQALAKNPGYVELRRLEAANNIAQIVSKSANTMYLNADSLLLNILEDSTTLKKVAPKD